MPGVSRSTKNAVISVVMGPGAVRVSRTHRVENCAKLVQTFWPLTIQLSPSLDRAGGQRCQVAAGAWLGKALAPLLLRRCSRRGTISAASSGRRVVDHRGREHLEHRIGAGFGQAAADHLFADDRAQHGGTAQSADLDRASRTASSRRRRAPLDPGELPHVALQRVVGLGGQIVVVEPRRQVGAGTRLDILDWSAHLPGPSPDSVRASGVVHTAAADEGHGAGLQSPPVGGSHIGVTVVADPHVVGGVVDEAQRLGAGGRSSPSRSTSAVPVRNRPFGAAATNSGNRFSL